jgi:HAD superfamily hydrolase (TIGR01459 family)
VWAAARLKPEHQKMSEPNGPVAGLRSIASAYDTILCDVWGVLHDGVRAYAGAGDALAAYREGGGRVVLITNAPRAAEPIMRRLDSLGIPRTAYDSLVSSGDMTRTMIAPYRGRVIHHVGPATKDDTVYEGLGVIRGSAEDAEAVVVTDLDDDRDTPEMYLDRLKFWLSRELPLICANPDKLVEGGDRLIWCGGAIADIYTGMGGTVLMAGKPYPPIYEEALRRAAAAAGRPIDSGRVLAVGDSVRTDAAGAASIDADLLFIAGMIHADDIAGGESVADIVEPSGARLIGYMPRLVW